ncbi:MAG TPA: hypothetical protein VIL85_08955 [Thermomicrobiales bacterium]|jgi:hypothetical protein
MRIRHLVLVLGFLASLLGGLVQAAPVGAAEQCFPQTGGCIQGRFLDYWLANGGLARNGYPLTGEIRQTLEDGNEYTVQYFERVRLEYHPEHPAPHEVQLGQFGRRVLREDYITVAGTSYEQATAPVPGSGPFYFPQTGHTIAPRFQDYWVQNGGLAQFGYPITEERFDSLGPDHCCTTQYFERARFEWHPENAGTPYVILLGQFGRRIVEDENRLSGTFGTIYRGEDRVRAALGRPLSLAVTTRGALQAFEGGRMYWAEEGPHASYSNGVESKKTILALCGTDEKGTIPSTEFYPFAPDTWTAADEPGGGSAPKPGLYLPQRGFGKLWREKSTVRQCIGYARTPDETGLTLTWQDFTGGLTLLSDTAEGRFIYVFTVRRNCNSCGNTITYERYPADGR